jgi:hypothetical protein
MIGTVSVAATATASGAVERGGMVRETGARWLFV